MQTLFRNPLAGPYVLGLSSGARRCCSDSWSRILPQWLTTIMLSSYGIVLASSLGSFSFNGRFSRLLSVARYYGYIDCGLMFGSLTSAIVGHSLISVLLSNYKNLPLVLGNLGIYPGHPLEFYSFAY
jgi:iron complex transport system permease protein